MSKCDDGDPNCAISYPHSHQWLHLSVYLNKQEYYTGADKTQAIMIAGIITGVLHQFKLTGIVTVKSESGSEFFHEEWVNGLKE